MTNILGKIILEKISYVFTTNIIKKISNVETSKDEYKINNIQEKDDIQISNAYEFLASHFLLTGEELGYYFEDSLGRSGWLLFHDKDCKDCLDQLEKRGHRLSSTNAQKLFKLSKMKSYFKLIYLKRKQAKKLTKVNEFFEMWVKIPRRFVLFLTGKEIAWLICLLKSKYELAENRAIGFYLSSDEKIIRNFCLSLEETKVFEIMPNWILERFSEKDIQRLFNCIQDSSLKFKKKLLIFANQI